MTVTRLAQSADAGLVKNKKLLAVDKLHEITTRFIYAHYKWVSKIFVVACPLQNAIQAVFFYMHSQAAR
jgi:hypothetical protein